MSTAKRVRQRSADQAGEGLGLAAMGSCGRWDVAIYETTAGARRWFAQIEGPTIYLYFQIPDPAVVGQAFRFLKCGGSAPTDGRATARADRADGSLRLGSFGRSAVLLTRDDEFPDRYFLVIRPGGQPSARVTLSGDDLFSLTEALEQAWHELDEGSWSDQVHAEPNLKSVRRPVVESERGTLSRS